MEAATIVVRRSRGLLVVQATGKTPRGQKYIKGVAPLKVKSFGDINFKSELAEAIDKLLSSEA